MDSLISKTQTSLCLIFILLLAPITSFAHNTENASGVQRQLLSSDVLPNVPAHKLTSMTVVLQPGVSVGAHKHDGFVYAYVLQGSVRTQLNNGEVVEYNVGDLWVEPPLVVHTLTENASKTEKAMLLVVFVTKEKANLSTSIKP